MVVVDFGIASAAGLHSLTLTGTVLGTAGYLSPEQAVGERAGPASDRYALAVVAYELLSGERPYASESVTAEAAAHVNAPVPSIAERCRNLPPEVDPVFRRALAKDPADRYETAADFVADLREALAQAAGTTGQLAVVAPAAAPRRSGRRSLAIPAALLLAAGAAGAVTAALVTGGGKKAAERVVTRHVTAPAAPPPPPPPAPAAGDGHSLNDRGYQLIQRGDFAGAVPLLQQAVRKLAGTGPGDVYEGYANDNLGYALYRSGRCSEAIPYLRRAEQLEPDRTEPADIRRRAERC